MIDANKTPETIEQATARYYRAMHAVQTGIAAMMELNDAETQPKHLRVGVNSALLNDAALAGLLIAKGIITVREYHIALADEAEKEVASYEQMISKAKGVKVTLA